MTTRYSRRYNTSWAVSSLSADQTIQVCSIAEGPGTCLSMIAQTTGRHGGSMSFQSISTCTLESVALSMSRAGPSYLLCQACHCLSCSGRSLRGLSLHGLSSHGLAFYGLSLHGLPFYGLPLHGLPLHGLSSLGLSSHGLSSHGLSLHGSSSHGRPSHGLSILPASHSTSSCSVQTGS